MGLYTVVTDANGRRIQFKTGYDGWDVWEYKLGDQAPFEPRDPNDLIPPIWKNGSVPDGVYSGLYEDWPADWCWVIVKDQRIIAIETAVVGFFTDEHRKLVKKYEIKPPPYRKLFSREAFLRRRLIKKAFGRRRIEEDREFKAAVENVPPEQRVSYLIARFMSEQMKRDGLMRKILPPVNVE